MAGQSSEVMLAQEQAVIRRGTGMRKAVGAAFGGGETEGTLVLTDKRLVYVHSNEKEEDIRIGAFSAKRLYFADVDDLASMKLDSESVEIPVPKILKVVGHKSEAVAPKLEVKWTEPNGAVRAAEFVQQITGSSRKKNLNDWAKVIEKIRGKQLRIGYIPPTPGEDKLEGKVLRMLADMQEKGVMTIEEEVEGMYKVDLDPDEVEAACDRLVAVGLAKKTSEKGEESFYRKSSLLGEDDLSG